jgi:hypothetical protein
MQPDIVIGEVKITGLLAAVLKVPVVEPVESGPKMLAVAHNASGSATRTQLSCLPITIGRGLPELNVGHLRLPS